jgi:hypothetical protein
MDAKNLAIVFGGVIFGEDEIPKGGDLLSVQNWKARFHTSVVFLCSSIFTGYTHGGLDRACECPLPREQRELLSTPATHSSRGTCAEI